MTGGSCHGSGEAQTTSRRPENMREAFRSVSRGLESIATKGMDLPVAFGRGRGDQFTFGHAVSMAITGYLLAPGLGEDLFAIHLDFQNPSEFLEWAGANPQLWGNGEGRKALSDPSAYGCNDRDVTVDHLAWWFGEVADRLAASADER